MSNIEKSILDAEAAAEETKNILTLQD